MTLTIGASKAWPQAASGCHEDDVHRFFLGMRSTVRGAAWICRAVRGNTVLGPGGVIVRCLPRFALGALRAGRQIRREARRERGNDARRGAKPLDTETRAQRSLSKW